MPQTGSGTGPDGFSPSIENFYPSDMADRLRAGQISQEEFDEWVRLQPVHDDPSDADADDNPDTYGQASPYGMAAFQAIAHALGLGFITTPLTIANAYNWFTEEEPGPVENVSTWGLNPDFTGIGGPVGMDDTTEATGAVSVSPHSAGAPAEFGGFSPPGDSSDGAPAGGSPGDPGAGVGEDSEAVGDPDADSGDDDEGSGDPGDGSGGGDDDGGADGSGNGGPGDYALGGLLSGSGPKDITAHGGEYVIRKSAVDKYGTDLFDMLNKGLLSV
tara:strand:+ start:701 stop:1519 length:819 start_codon:yes stop_codon:yes gene_type:complete